MSSAIKTITFATRQNGLRACNSLLLHFEAGTAAAEYVPASEVQDQDGAWQYQLYINEDDLPGGMSLSDVRESAFIEPYWSCAEEEPQVDECPARNINTFTTIEELNDLLDDDKVAIVRFDEECEVFQLLMADKALVLAEAEGVEQTDVLPYEAYLPTDEIEGGDSTYVAHIPVDIMVRGVRLSCAQYGESGQLKVELRLGGVSMFDSGAAGELIPTGGTVLIDGTALSPSFEGATVPAGTVLTAHIVEAANVPYGTNFKGLRVDIIGVYQ